MKAFVKPTPSSTTVERADVPVPQVGPGEVLVQVRAIGVGIHDSYFLPPEADDRYPVGIEGAGIVAEVGSGVTQHQPGDRVAFVSSMQPKGGTWAEHAVVDAGSLILPMPDGLRFVEASTLPVAGNTVLRTLAAVGSLPEGSSLFVSGGAGAIGSLTIQIARRRGWRVAASASPHNHDFLRSLGAETVVDYHDAGWPDQVRAWRPEGVDAAVAVHPGTSASTLAVVKDGGSVITVSGDRFDTVRGIRGAMIDYQVDVRHDLVALMTDVVTKDLHLEIERVYPFAEAPQALARVQTRHVRGKLVLRLEPDLSAGR